MESAAGIAASSEARCSRVQSQAEADCRKWVSQAIGSAERVNDPVRHVSREAPALPRSQGKQAAILNEDQVDIDFTW